MSHLSPVSGPHAHGPATVTKIMVTVMVALLPATAFGIYQFGWPALNLFIITLISALLTEAICLKIAGLPIKPALMDGSALLSAWLLALTLPPWAPWWIAVVGSVCAILLGKQVFGGLGQNVFNPAMLARVVLLISFPVQMTSWVEPAPFFSDADRGFQAGLQVTFGHLEQKEWDSITTASPLGHLKTELTLNHSATDILADLPTWLDSLLGTTAGSMGETSALLLLLGGLFLIARGVITWHAPLALLLTVTVISSMFYLVDPNSYAPPQFHLLNGALILAAFFIITDPVTSPNTIRGQIYFSIGCGILVFIIRTWGSYPEAVGFAVLLMNSFTPLIDHYVRPRIYGRNRKGEPLHVTKDNR